MNPPHRALYLDRDGTLIEDVGYLNDPAGVNPLPGVADALATLRRHGYLLLVVSNQSGIGRGLISWEHHLAVHRRFVECFAAQGVLFDDVRYCPHAPWEACVCRKPHPTPLQQLAQAWGIALGNSFMVGDKTSDIMTGQHAGCRTILVAGDAVIPSPPLERPADLVVGGLPEAVKFLTSDLSAIK